LISDEAFVVFVYKFFLCQVLNAKFITGVALCEASYSHVCQSLLQYPQSLAQKYCPA